MVKHIAQHHLEDTKSYSQQHYIVNLPFLDTVM